MTTSLAGALDRLTDVPDFPSPGVLFKDITPLLADPEAFATVVEALAAVGRDGSGTVGVDKVAGLEARGFLFGVPVAQALGVGFVPFRKAGKLPRETHAAEYALEYGTATVEIHTDAIGAGERVLVIDDVLATGGTMAAACDLIGRCDGVVHGIAVLMELVALDGRQALPPVPVTALRAV